MGMGMKAGAKANMEPRKAAAGSPAPGRPGRPRAFSETEALDAAMRVFWERGYEGTSLDDLTEAMGINRSSLYATFGDKETLFRGAITRYAEGPVSYIQKALEQPTARGVIEALLRNTAEALGDTSHPRGCLLLQGGLACGSGAESVKQALINWRRNGEAAVEKRMKRARKEGDLPQDVDPKDLARYVSIVMTGLGVQAANGATKTEMTRAVDLVLRSLPL